MDRGAVVAYLRQRPELAKLQDKELVEDLKAAGLVSRSTYWRDMNVVALRREAAMPPRPVCPHCGGEL